MSLFFYFFYFNVTLFLLKKLVIKNLFLVRSVVVSLSSMFLYLCFAWCLVCFNLLYCGALMIGLFHSYMPSILYVEVLLWLSVSKGERSLCAQLVICWYNMSCMGCKCSISLHFIFLTYNHLEGVIWFVCLSDTCLTVLSLSILM